MLLTLLADPHIADDSAQTNGVNTKANFNQCVSRIRQLQPDHVVFMGDYSAHAPQRKDVDYVCSRLGLAEVEFSAIAGNHDTSRDVAEVCGSEAQLIGERLYYRRDFGRDTALFLDTSKGYLERDQLDWLKMHVDAARERLLVFMHHPPLEMGVPFMDDKHALRDRDGDLYNILFTSMVPLHIFCGHYHTARSTQVGIHSVHLCASTYFQLDPSQQDFAVSHAMPALRHVELLAGEVRTWVDVLAMS